jgi:hypothetical protein
VSVLPKQMLEVGVGSRQVGLLVTVEQACSIAAGHLQEVVQRLLQRTKPAFDQPHRLEHPSEAALDGSPVCAIFVRKHLSGGVNPTEDCLDRPPSFGRFRQGFLQQTLHSLKR